MDKSKQIWSRFNTDQKQLKLDCVDMLGRFYTMLGQKPETEQIVMMAQLLYEDLINRYSRMTIDEVRFAIEKGIRDGDDTSCFINVRTWNVWLKKHITSEQLNRQKNILTNYQNHQQAQKLISTTIEQAKKLGQ